MEFIEFFNKTSSTESRIHIVENSPVDIFEKNSTKFV